MCPCVPHPVCVEETLSIPSMWECCRDPYVSPGSHCSWGAQPWPTTPPFPPVSPELRAQGHRASPASLCRPPRRRMGREDSQGFRLFQVPHVGLLVPWHPARDTKREVRHLGEAVLVPMQGHLRDSPLIRVSGCKLQDREQRPKHKEITTPWPWSSACYLVPSLPPRGVTCQS